MNNVYLYNNNFISLLELIKVLLQNKIKPFNIKNNHYGGSLLDNLIKLDLKENTNIIKEYIQVFNQYHFKLIYYVYLSEEENKELIIYYFLLNYFKYHNNLTRMRNLKCVSETLKIAKKVGNECHKFKGFTRFKELNNQFLYAEINPDNNILYLLSIHFKKRLKNEYWLIKDVKRKIVSIYDKKDFYIIEDKYLQIIDNTSKNEEEITMLWKNFYQTIGIKERKNDRCRMNFMPKKYWPYLLEVEDEL